MAIKKCDIYRSLWDSCDQFRGGMDASLYKDYILTLLFLKYVSDRAEKHDSLIEVPEACSFEDLKKLRGTKDIGEGIDTAIAGIADPTSRIVCSLIHKFGKREESELGELISEIQSAGIGAPAGDFYVIIDEAHRTQSGIVAPGSRRPRHPILRRLLPETTVNQADGGCSTSLSPFLDRL